MPTAHLDNERILRPAMRAWLRMVERRESDTAFGHLETRVHSPGVDAYRVLLMGSGIALGWGVQAQGLALPGAIARALTSATGVGADVEIVADPRMSPSDVARRLTELPVERFDAIVLSVGVPEAIRLHSLESWRDELSALVSTIADAVPAATTVVLTGIPRIRSVPRFDSALADVADRRARALDAVSQQVCAATGQVRFLPIAENRVARSIRAATVYDHWGVRIAGALLATLRSRASDVRNAYPAAYDSRPPHASDDGFDIAQRARRNEAPRQRAVDLLPAHAIGGTPQMKRIVSLARSAFGTEAAMFTILDGDTQYNAVRDGVEAKQFPRAISFCATTIRGRGETVVADARLDPRFASSPLVVGEPFVRFYAGFPVEAPSGERVGALCVMGTSPRTPGDQEVLLLRELALAIQAELWTVAPTEASGQSSPPTS